MIRPRRGTVAVALTLAALATWGWNLSTNVGRGPHPRRGTFRVERPAERAPEAREHAAGAEDGAAAGGAPPPATDVAAPEAALAALAERLERCAAPADARAPDLDALLVAAAAPEARAFPAGADDGPRLEGTWVRDGVRLAALDGRLVTEGEALPGGGRVARIDAGGVVIARGVREVRLELGRARRSGP
jgi:hypothetical protein